MERPAGQLQRVLGCTLRRTAEELYEESNLTVRFELVGDLGLHDTRALGGQHLFLELWLKNAVAQRSLQNADAPPDAWLRSVATSQRGGNSGLRELSGALICNDIRRK